MTQAHELVAAGRPKEALTALQGQVRSHPSDPKLRVFLFQLLCTLGQWERAAAQLEVCAQLDASTLAMVNTYREALRCERMRDAVFAGRHTPVLMGEPQDWMMKLVAALKLQADGDSDGAARLREQAFEEAPATPGTAVSAEDSTEGDEPPAGTAFDWIADADSRLGPVLEVVVNGRYAWLPFNALRRVRIEPPEDLRDLVWAPAQMELVNGGEMVALIPTRYAPFEADDDEALLMSRGTDWLDLGHGQYAGRGHRVLTTSAAERPLLQWRELRLAPASA